MRCIADSHVVNYLTVEAIYIIRIFLQILSLYDLQGTNRLLRHDAKQNSIKF